MSGWNGDAPPTPMRQTVPARAGGPPPLPPPARPRLSTAIAHWSAVAQNDRNSYTERALACRITAALAAAEATVQHQAQTLALLSISDQLGAILGALTPPPGTAPDVPQPD